MARLAKHAPRTAAIVLNVATAPATMARLAAHALTIAALVLNAPIRVVAISGRAVMYLVARIATRTRSVGDHPIACQMEAPSSALARVVTAAEMTIAVAAVTARATAVARRNA